MPRVTVIMPAYNRSATIARAVRSVRLQSMDDWELRVVDDGSSDATAEAAWVAAAGDARISVHKLPVNIGAAAAMNHAWQQSDAPFVAILDSDDVAMPDRLRRQLRHFDDHPDADVLGGAAHFVDDALTYLRTVCLPQTHARLAMRRWYACPFVHPTVMMRRSFLELTGGYTAGLRYGEDYDLWLRGFAMGRFRYGNLTEPLVIYRARRVQRWSNIRAAARVRLDAGRREGCLARAGWGAARVVVEGLIEQSGIYSWRDRLVTRLLPAEVQRALERTQ